MRSPTKLLKRGILARGTNSLLPALVLMALVGAGPALTQRPAEGTWREEVQRLRDAAIARLPRGGTKADLRQLGMGGKATPAVLRAAAASTVAESEPNGDVGTADGAALGDRATGVVNPAGDADTWFVDLAAGQYFSVDVDASATGSPLDPTLLLFAPDGITLLASNDDFDGLDSRISYRVPTGGRYFVVIRAFGAAGTPALTYTINFGTVVCAGVGTEQEPNDSPGTATPVAIGASGSGEVCSLVDHPAGDVDYWAFTAQAGTTIELDVDAAALGLLVDPFLALFGSDGTTRLTFNDDQDGADSRLQFSITSTGTYYATVSALTEPNGNPFPYTLHVRAIPSGPGDPITVRVAGLGLPLGLAFGSAGDLFVGDVTGNRVVRVSSQGTVTSFASGVVSPLGLAFDAFDNLLVASGDGIVYRVTLEGQVTPLIADATSPFWIAVAPDGRIWLTDVSDRSLRRYDPTGHFEARFDVIDVGGFGPGPLAIGPSGEPYFSNGNEIWKLVNGAPRRVFGAEAVIWGFAFDAAGNIYAPLPAAGRLALFDATGATVADPLAVGPDAPQALAFARDAAGATVARLFATDPLVGTVIEVNPAAISLPGLPVGSRTPTITLEAAAGALLGETGLSSADRQFLDGLGNRNGRYDVGDLRAHLTRVSALPGADSGAAQHRPGSSP